MGGVGALFLKLRFFMNTKTQKFMQDIYRLVESNRPIRARKRLRLHLNKLREQENVDEFFWLVGHLDLRRLDPDSASVIGIMRTQFLGGMQRDETFQA